MVLDMQVLQLEGFRLSELIYYLQLKWNQQFQCLNCQIKSMLKWNIFFFSNKDNSMITFLLFQFGIFLLLQSTCVSLAVMVWVKSTIFKSNYQTLAIDLFSSCLLLSWSLGILINLGLMLKKGYYDSLSPKTMSFKHQNRRTSFSFCKLSSTSNPLPSL